MSCLVLARPASAAMWPETIPLPIGFRPEGIEIGPGNQFFVGSIPTGAIYSGNLRTGEGGILVPPMTGRAAIGLGFDPRSGYLFVAGGPTGVGYIYDGGTGTPVTRWQFASGLSFVNDAVITRDAAYFTESLRPVLYRVPLGPGGEPGNTFEEIPLNGVVFGPGTNSNGIEATPNGEWLIVVNSASGELYRVDPATGDVMVIDLGGESLTNGDGLLLQGHTLYVVRNRLNLIAVVALNGDFTAGALVEEITNPAFRVPTTIARHGHALYAVNARFGTPDPDHIDYDLVRVEF